MKQLIELAQKIKNEELRKRVVEFLKNPQLTHKDFKKYPKMEVDEAKTLFTVGGPQGGVTVERDVLNHTLALADICLKIADTVERSYGIPINRDNLIAAAILHDIMKIFEHKMGPQGLEHTGVLLDHTMLAVGEFYHRGIPEEVIHIIASHFGETGPTPPKNFEALIFHHLDSLLSLTEFHLYAPKAQQPMQLVVLDDETIRKLGGKPEKKIE